jgi:hypothetical protein
MQKGFQKVYVHSCGDGVIATPVIGENGNWYVGNDDTGVRAEGFDGKDGEMGPVGPQGPKGAQGDVGPEGPQGLKGDTGAEGPQGPKGEKGDKGDQGEMGLQGLKGDTGATGSQGPKGDTGAMGPQGPIGETPALVANLTTTVAGKALDATMGKVLDDKISVNTGNISTINSNLGNCKFSYDGTDFYATYGSVKKKLGEAGVSVIYTQDVTGTSGNFRGYSDGWIDYTIPTIAGYTFFGGFIKYISIQNTNANLKKMNVEIQTPVAGVLRVLPVGDSSWPSGGNSATCTLTLVYAKNYI